MRILSIFFLCGLLFCPAVFAADGDPLTSNFGTSGADIDSNKELGGVPVAYANTTTTATVNCAAGGISNTSITVVSATNFDTTGGTAAICDTTGRCNVFTYTSITGATFNGVANAAAGQVPTCTGNYASGARVYGMTPATNLAHRLKVLMQAVQNAQGFLGFGAFSTLPTSPSEGQIYVITDAITAGTCLQGGADFRAICQWKSSQGIWVPIGDGNSSSLTLSQVLANGSQATNLSPGKSNAVKICSPNLGCWYDYFDSNGPVRECEAGDGSRCDETVHIASGRRWHLFDEANSGYPLEFVPGAASANLMWQYTQVGSRPFKEVFIGASAFSTDGTQCAAPAEGTLAASKPKTWTITCTDNDAARMEVAFAMPGDWDGSPLYVRPYWYTNSTQAAKNIVQSFSGQCVRAGDTVANVATTGEQNVTVTIGTSANEEGNAETPAMTPQGTCAAGADLYLTGDIDATGTTITTIANARFRGVKVRYRVSSGSS